MFQIVILLNTLLETALQIEDPDQFNNYLILGYIAMWAIGMVYILLLANKQRNAREDLELMTQLLREDEESAEA